MAKDVVLVTGLGTMGLAIARRLGNRRRLLLVDNDPARVAEATDMLGKDGYDIVTRIMDLAEPEAPAALAQFVADNGPLKIVAHTAGISQALTDSADRIYQVNFAGSTRVIDALLPLATERTVGVVIASMGAQFWTLTPEVETILATAPVETAMATIRQLSKHDDKGVAYLIARRGNQLRVEFQSLAWAKKGARLFTISPGLISTAQGRLEHEVNPPVGEILASTPMQRIGTPDDIAAAVEWATGPAASYLTGTDVRVDGGCIAQLRWGKFAADGSVG